MSEIKVGMEVRHKASGDRGVVTEINGKNAKVSYDFDKLRDVTLAALEPVEEDDGPHSIEPSF